MELTVNNEPIIYMPMEQILSDAEEILAEYAGDYKKMAK